MNNGRAFEKMPGCFFAWNLRGNEISEAPWATYLGQSGDADEKRIQELIEQKKLFGRNARFYQKTDQ